MPKTYDPQIRLHFYKPVDMRKGLFKPGTYDFYQIYYLGQPFEDLRDSKDWKSDVNHQPAYFEPSEDVLENGDAAAFSYNDELYFGLRTFLPLSITSNDEYSLNYIYQNGFNHLYDESISVEGSKYDDYLTGGADDDMLFGREGNDTLDGGAGDDVIWAGDGDDTIYKSSGDDYYLGGDGIDTLMSIGDKDEIFEAGKNTFIEYVKAGGGDDIVKATNFQFVYGQGGNDKLYGKEAQDKLYGGSGNDLLIGGSNDDRLFGNSGNDILKGGSFDDRLSGGSGRDKLYGGSRDDKLIGGSGNDKLYGQKGNDKLNGGRGNDRLSGGNGKDRLVGGSGSDRLSGGKNADTFVLQKGKGYDKITYFSKVDSFDVIGFNDSKVRGVRKKGDVYLYAGRKDLLAIVLDGNALGRLL